MANKLAKKYITQAAKTVPSSQWKARGLKKAWALQRAAKKGGKKPAKAKPKGKPKSKPKGNPKGGSTSSNKSPKIGATIQAFKGTQPLVSPVIAVGVRRGVSAEAVERLRTKANISYAGNVAATAINQAVDRKIAQGAALSRGSITAWAPEAFAAFEASKEVRGVSGKQAILGVNRSLAQTINGYNPDTGKMDLANPKFRTYQGLKVIGGIARRASNMGPLKRISAPLKKFLGEMGGAL